MTDTAPSLRDPQWRPKPRRLLVRIASELVATTFLLLSFASFLVILTSGPDITASDFGRYLDVLRWLTIAPEVALGAVGLIAGFIITISFTGTTDDASGVDEEDGLRVYRGRVILLETCATAAVVIAVMVAFRMVTSDDLTEVRENFGLSAISIFSCLAASGLAQLRSRHEQFERELALRRVDSIEHASRKAADAWNKGWPGVSADPSVKPWISGRPAIVVFAAFVALCSLAQLAARVMPAGGLVAPTPTGVVLIAGVQVVLLFALPILIVGYVTHRLRSARWKAEKAFVVSLGIFAIGVTTLPVLLLGLTQMSALGAALVCGVPLVLLVMTLYGMLSRRPLASSAWVPWAIAQRAFQDIARRAEGLRRYREQHRAERLRSSV